MPKGDCFDQGLFSRTFIPWFPWFSPFRHSDRIFPLKWNRLFYVASQQFRDLLRAVRLAPRMGLHLAAYQPLSEYSFAYGLKTEMSIFNEFLLVSLTEKERKHRAQFSMFPSTVWTGHEYGLDGFLVRFSCPLR